MKQGLLVAVGGAALLIAGLAGCSSDDKAGSKESSASSSSSKSESSEASTSAEAASETRVVLDGEEQPAGNVSCNSISGTNTISIGEQGTGVVVVLGNDDTSVTSVAFGSTAGQGYAVGGGQGDATVEKDGKSYTIKGTAVGADITNPTAGIQKKPFEIQAVCP